MNDERLEQLAKTYGLTVAEVIRQYADRHNYGARIADDRFCQTTGQRGRICDVDVSSDSPSRFGDGR